MLCVNVYRTSNHALKAKRLGLFTLHSQLKFLYTIFEPAASTTEYFTIYYDRIIKTRQQQQLGKCKGKPTIRKCLFNRRHIYVNRITEMHIGAARLYMTIEQPRI